MSVHFRILFLKKLGGFRVSIDNDTRAMIYGEYMQGAVKGEKEYHPH